MGRLGGSEASAERFGRHPRLPASLHYIAEIIGQCDLIRLVELRDDVNELARVLRLGRVLRAHSLRNGPKGRLPELELLARWVEERTRDPNFTDKDLIVVGDFNVPDEASELFAAIRRCGLRMPTSFSAGGLGLRQAHTLRVLSLCGRVIT